MEPLELLGIGSALLVLSAFVLNEYGKLSSESVWYDGVNFVASLGLLWYAASNHVWPFVITNSVWALVSGIDTLRYCVGRGHRKRRRN